MVENRKGEVCIAWNRCHQRADIKRAGGHSRQREQNVCRDESLQEREMWTATIRGVAREFRAGASVQLPAQTCPPAPASKLPVPTLCQVLAQSVG